MIRESPDAVVREMRLAAGLSQRELALRAGTSQPAIARYERGAAVPSWGTLQRIAGACGRTVSINVELIPDPRDVELARAVIELTPLERLRSLAGFARLHQAAVD